MRRLFRQVRTAIAFAVFFLASLILGFVLLPCLRLTSRNREQLRDRVTGLVHRGYQCFVQLVKWLDLVRIDALAAPPGVDKNEPFVMIANHPSLIDAVILQARFPQLMCVAKGSYYHSWVFHPILSMTHYIPGSDGKMGSGTLEAVVEALDRGHPVLMFPEGTRSGIDSLGRFRRGAIAAAADAKVPLVSLFIDPSPRTLLKGQKFWHIPERASHYRWEYFPTLRVLPENARIVFSEIKNRYRQRFEHSLQQTR